MKPGTKISLIIAAILIVSGIIVSVIGGVMAKGQKVELLCDTVVDDDAITTEDIEDLNVDSCNIDVDGIAVNICGDCEKSYVEFVNINRAEYNFTVKNHQLEIKTINPFSINDIWNSYIYNIRENNGGFNGLRHYIFINKYSDKTSKINIYLSKNADISKIVAAVENAGLYVHNIYSAKTNYTLSATNGNLTVSAVYSTEKADVTCNNGKLNLLKANISNINVNANKAAFNVAYNMQCNYNLTGAGGIITVDGTDCGSVFAEYYPPTTKASEATSDVPNALSGTIVDADVTISEFEEGKEY